MRRLILVALAICLTACTMPSAQPVSPLAQPTSPLVIRRVFLPLVANKIQCLTLTQVIRFSELMAADGRQQRTAMRCHPALVRAAQSRADEMARTSHFAHCDLKGVCANEYARAAGCRLPAHYVANGNNIESIAAGSFSADAIFAALARSPSHAPHLFGEGDFFRAQEDLGIAVGIGGRYGWWWVILIGTCEG